jgi:outer membrane receptor protein involved in Fe transport
MTFKRNLRFFLCAPAFLAAAGAPVALAQSGSGIEEVIVTAQKREQSLNDVGLTIQAASGQALADRGIQSPSDLTKLVPGFSYTESIWSTPVYTLRGIGLYDATFGAVPAVAIYSDQVPRNTPVASLALDLDVARVEVLKGPQGTLFGQSSTGGAINYVTAKPGEEFEAGFRGTYGRFGRFEGEGFVSGPVSDTLGARLAIRTVQGGDWQKSSSRGEENGEADKTSGRLTLVWNPSDAFRAETSFTYAKDQSDPQAPQYLKSVFNTYTAAGLAAANANPATANPFGVVNEALYASLTTPTSPNYDSSFLGRQATLVARLNGADPVRADGARAVLGTRTTNSDARLADWTPGLLSTDNEYKQGTLRLDWNLTDEITLTSVTALATQDLDYGQDVDGTRAIAVDVPVFGSVDMFNQELRLAGKTDTLNWIIGASYDDVDTEQNNFYGLEDYSGNEPIPGLPIQITSNEFESTLESKGVFGNIEFQATDALSLTAGVRYTKNDQTASYCYNDPPRDPNQNTATVFSVFEWLFTGSGPAGPQPIGPGECFVLGDGFDGTTFGVATRSPVERDLDEDNWSYRLGANYKLEQGTLLYATVSQGYKAGVFSAIGASSTRQYAPAFEEKVVAYEAGFKAPLADRTVNLNAAAFYYDYKDKQVRGRIADPIYGLLEKMINVPKSYVYGAEADIVLQPTDGLTITAAATWLKAQVDGDFSQTPDNNAVYNAQGYTGNFDKADLPFTPEWSGNLDAVYEFPVSDGMVAFVGGTVVYMGSQNTTFENSTLSGSDFEIESYTTLDLRAGVASTDDTWRATVWGRNVTDEFYTTSVTTYLDTLFRFTGRPATYGVTVDYRF